LAVLLSAVAVSPPSAWGVGLTLVAPFDGTNGANPVATVTFDSAGNAYGTASLGGSSGLGTVWELMKGSGTITALASFNGTNGSSPFAGVTLDANGNAYGTTDVGGANGVGVVWELAKGSGTITALASFDTTNGAFPRGPVTIDAKGNLFGTTEGGGIGGGVVWELAKGSSTIQALASFTSTSGVNPAGRVTFDSAGNAYGTAQNGGANGKGTVWELTNGSTTINALASFNTTNGASPFGPVTLDAHGNLFGTALNGGANFGTVWELAKGSSTINALASFDVTNGAGPSGPVTFDSNGNLFGTATNGGAGFGTVWELVKGSSSIQAIGSFDSTHTGADPVDGVTFGSDGNLYGTAQSGGPGLSGTIWEIQLSAVPEPSSLVLGLMGLALAAGTVVVRSRRPS
jgi:uncharacterized repeat protein (TIGR03803 family)